jgi:hypothetical protein
LGTDWRAIHERLLHTPGNLTLVGSDYNLMMQKKPFDAKKPVLVNSVVYLNKYFGQPALTAWDQDAILKRGHHLAELAAKVWAGPS